MNKHEKLMLKRHLTASINAYVRLAKEHPLRVGYYRRLAADAQRIQAALKMEKDDADGD
jgi:hypothetical protein